MSHSSTPSLNRAISRILRVSGSVFVGASILLPAQSILASSFDGQSVHVNSGESVQVNCAAGDESVAQLDQVGNTRYYSLRCAGGGSSSSGSTPPMTSTTVENSGSKTTVHLGADSAVHIVCYGGSANLDTAGNTRYYALNCQ